MRNYPKRKITRINISSIPTVSISHPESTVLSFGERSSQDIGALCYLRRSPRENGVCERLVDLSSFDEKRAKSIIDVITVLSDNLLSGRLNKNTLSERARTFIRFMDWCDDNDHTQALYDLEHAKSGLNAFIQHLKEKIRLGNISLVYAGQIQYKTISLLSDLLNTDDLYSGLRLIVGGSSKNPTSPQDDKDSGRVLSLCSALFEGFSELVLENRPYPFKLSMPSILGWKDDFLWVIPSRTWCLPPHLRSEFTAHHKAWSYNSARILNINEIIDKYSSKYAAENAINATKKRLITANTDLYCNFRLWRAASASAAFFQLFLANTGMNHAQARELRWHNDMKVVKERQGFVGIKARAFNKSVTFEIQKSFLNSFKKYLKLRKYLLLDHSCDLLFFSRERTFKEAPKKLPINHTSNFIRHLRHLDPGICNFGPRQWRANKADWLIRNEDVSTTAAILQNKETTVLKHYSAGSETRATEEFGSFFEQLTILKNKGPDAIVGTSSGVGYCSDYGNARFTDNAPSVNPDCNQPEGCLFCGHYFVHADETDIRKLVSCRYCICQTAHLSASDEHFKSIFGPILERIENIFNLMKNTYKESAQMIERITIDVEENENLDRYWGEKLQMLIELGVISH